MPELPEVETIRLQLNKLLVGHKVLDVDIRTAKTFQDNPEIIIGAKIIGVRRFAKILAIDFANNYSLLVHLKMTGQLIYRGPNLTHVFPSTKITELGGKHTRVIINLDKGGKLYFNDYRMFGWMRIVQSVEFNAVSPEPLKDLNLEIFKKIIKSSKRPIKIQLMDQAKIAGIGNIYANDALWLAKVRPQRPANSLSGAEQKLLYNAINKILKQAIKSGGSSETAYVAPDGTEGTYQNNFLVYNRAGKKCLNNCGSVITKIKFAGRGTYFCPLCQI